MDVSVIVVNYNTKFETKNCIDSIFKCTSDVNFEVILVDNGSTDGSIELFSHDKRIILISSNNNIGFGRANNLAYKYAIGKYIFLLNSDTIILNNTIKLFFNYAESHQSEKIGALGCLLLDVDKNITHSYGRFPTPMNSLFFILSSYTRRIGIDIHKWYFTEKSAVVQSIDVDYITGADLFIPRQVIDHIGLFTPAFFMYFEETDLQKRMEYNKFIRRIIYGPLVIHIEGASMNKEKKSVLKEILFRKSEFLYLKLHGNSLMYIIYRILLFILSLLPVLCMDMNIRDKKKYLLFLFCK